MKGASIALATLLAVAAANKEYDPESRSYDTTVTLGDMDATTHEYGRFDKTSKSLEPSLLGTHEYGRFDKTSKSLEPSLLGTHEYGRFDKTSKSLEPSLLGTHEYGRFDKTSKSLELSLLGTHEYGRFDKTSKSLEPSLLGTHEYGRFDKTKPSSSATLYVGNPEWTMDGFLANSSNHTAGLHSSINAGRGSYGIGFAGAVAIAALMLI